MGLRCKPSAAARGAAACMTRMRLWRRCGSDGARCRADALRCALRLHDGFVRLPHEKSTMLAPIFTWELQRTMHRRWFHAAWLSFAAIRSYSLFSGISPRRPTFLKHPDFRRSLPTFLGQTSEFQHYLKVSLYGLIFLLTPILATGPILQEKRQKTLELLLTTQQRSADIVLSHWLAAIVKLLILTSPVVPALIWMHAFRGETPMTWIIAWIGCVWPLALPMSAWSVLVAVYARQTITARFGYAGQRAASRRLGAGRFATPNSRRRVTGFDARFLGELCYHHLVPTVLCLTIAICVYAVLRRGARAPVRAAATGLQTLTASDRPICGSRHIAMIRCAGFRRLAAAYGRGRVP